jgi:hypothetical protein
VSIEGSTRAIEGTGDDEDGLANAFKGIDLA